MKSPRIVIGCAVYNEAEYLEETIPAVLAQTMPYFTLVALDNGSTDATPEILKRYAEQDERLIYMRVPRNVAPAHAANAIWPVALAEWPLCRWFLAAGADDVMHPDYLEAVLAAALEYPDVNLIFSPWEYIDGKRPPRRFPAYDPDSVHQIHQLPAWAAFTRGLYSAVGQHNPEAGLGSDWEWYVRAAVAGVLRPHQLDRPYISLRVRDGARQSQSDENHWPTLHRLLCGVARKPVPAWARA